MVLQLLSLTDFAYPISFSLITRGCVQVGSAALCSAPVPHSLSPRWAQVLDPQMKSLGRGRQAKKLLLSKFEATEEARTTRVIPEVSLIAEVLATTQSHPCSTPPMI